jgi:hypothetical protein
VQDYLEVVTTAPAPSIARPDLGDISMIIQGKFVPADDGRDPPGGDAFTEQFFTAEREGSHVRAKAIFRQLMVMGLQGGSRLNA